MADLRFNVTAETRAATAALGAFAQDVQKKLVNAVRALPNIELTADSTDAQREMKRLRDELAALANKRVGIDIDAGDALAEMSRLQSELRTLGGSTAEVGVRADVSAAEAALGDVEAEIRRLNGADAEVEVTADTAQAESKLEGFGDKAKAGAAAAGVAIGAALTQGIASNMEMDTARARLTAQLGLTAEESERIGGVAGNLYANAYGESIGEVGDAVASVMQKIGGMSEASSEDLESVTGKIISLAETMEIDIGQATGAVGQMIRNGLAKDAVEAMDLLARGAQTGANRMDDLADTFNEYGETFQVAGMDGATAMGVMSQAMEAGAWSSDLVTDSIREFGIIAQAGGKDSSAAFKTLGLDAGKMADDVAAGGDRSVAALDSTLDALRKMPPSAERSALAVALFGTKAEEMGDSLFAIDPSQATAKLGDFAGTMERADAALGATAAAKVTALQRGFEQWTASIVATEGPLGDVATGISAFGPMAMGAVTAIGPLLVALKMGGIAAAIRSGPVGAIDEVGNAADRSERRTGGLKKGLMGIGAVVGIGLVAKSLDDINIAAAGGENNLGLMEGNLHDLVGAGEELLSMNFGGIWSEIGQEWDQMVRHLSGTDIPDINIDVKADPSGAASAMNDLMGQVNSASAKVNIDGNPAPAAFALRKILGDIAAGKETVLINGEPMPALEALDYVKGLINAGAGDVTINGETMPASEALGRFLGEVAAKEGKMMIGADPTIALSQLDTVQSAINARIGTMTINGNKMPADQALGAVLAAIDAGAATVTINGNKVPSEQALTTLLDQVNAGAGTVVINGNKVPAGDVLAALIASISSAQGTSTINGQATPAYNALNAFLGSGNRSTTTPTLYANATPAYNAANSFYNSQNGRVITYRTAVQQTSHIAQGGKTGAIGGIVRAMKDGGVLGFANGGVGVSLTPMSGGIAQVVPPNTLRVIGDRVTGDEFFIPDDESPRSLAIGREWARRRDMALVPRDALGLAPGGVVKHGTVSDAEWQGLKDQGWKGRAGDGQEALYAPGGGGGSSGGISSGMLPFGSFSVTARMMAGGAVLTPAKGSALSVAQARAGWFRHEDGSFSNVNEGRWAGAGLAKWRQQTQAKALAQAQQALNGRVSVGAGSTAARVTDAVRSPVSSAAGSGPVAVIDTATRAEVAALRREVSTGNYGAAQLAALRSLQGALAAAAQGSATATAQAGLTKSVTGAW